MNVRMSATVLSRVYDISNATRDRFLSIQGRSGKEPIGGGKTENRIQEAEVGTFEPSQILVSGIFQLLERARSCPRSCSTCFSRGNSSAESPPAP
jgi:hypothetical protein